ncbi:MAG: hypothetical protein ACO3PV_04950 [Pseudohongiellaceae bacterium]
MNKLKYSVPAALSLLASAVALAQAPAPSERAYPDGYITGQVTGPNGPEAGVWVIAETKETNTPLIKIVVTDDEGRYALPQLPEATYSVWVRGYGLLDSAKLEGRPGDTELNLSVELAPTPQEAAKVYPGDYWLSLLDVPDNLPGTGPVAAGGNGFMPAVAGNPLDQNVWVHEFKADCNFCHQLGSQITRTLGHMDALGFDSHEEAWIYRTSLGVRGGSMQAAFLQFGIDGMSKTMADWTRKVEAGEVPPAPPRPQGVERNVVVTLWDTGGDHDFMHDEIATDKNNPTVNAFGPIYAVSAGHGTLEVVDPVTNDAYKFVIPTREDPREVSSRFPPPGNPSNFWGMQHLWGLENPADPHNPMMGPDGRVWMTSKIRNANPDWCREGSSHKFAQYYPLTFSNRQASVFDPETQEFELIDTCFATHHLQFANDPDNTLYFNELLGPMFGWINTRLWDRTHDEQLSQGWCPQVIDTNGDGVITKPWNPADSENPDPALDTEVRKNLYTVIPDPKDGNIVWGVSEDYPGYLVRLDRGLNPPESCIAEVYEVPPGSLDPRGMDIDTEGNPWVAMAASSEWGKFERSKCEVLNGPGTDKGQHCEAGWTTWKTPGPRLGNTDMPADFHYFGWVDQHNTSGLGVNTPILTGSNSDSLIALDPETSEWTYMRVPYPLGFYQRGMDGRIDDPDAGWKGRGLYANYGTHLVWHIEGGKGTKGKIVKFQVRENPLQY